MSAPLVRYAQASLPSPALPHPHTLPTRALRAGAHTESHTDTDRHTQTHPDTRTFGDRNVKHEGIAHDLRAVDARGIRLLHDLERRGKVLPEQFPPKIRGLPPPDAFPPVVAPEAPRSDVVLPIGFSEPK